MSLQEIGWLIASRDVSPVELTQRMLDRIKTLDPALNSYATVMADHAVASARAAEQEIQAGKYRGPLHGVPIAVKDLCYTKGTRTMGGSAVRKDFVPDVDATVVTKLDDAGAVLLGKLNHAYEGATSWHARHPGVGYGAATWTRSTDDGLPISKSPGGTRTTSLPARR